MYGHVYTTSTALPAAVPRRMPHPCFCAVGANPRSEAQRSVQGTPLPLFPSTQLVSLLGTFFPGSDACNFSGRCKREKGDIWASAAEWAWAETICKFLLWLRHKKLLQQKVNLQRTAAASPFGTSSWRLFCSMQLSAITLEEISSLCQLSFFSWMILMSLMPGYREIFSLLGPLPGVLYCSSKMSWHFSWESYEESVFFF